MNGYYKMLPGETIETRHARWRRTDIRVASFKEAHDSIVKLAKETDNESLARGFVSAYLEMMFENLAEDDQNLVLERFKEMDSKLLLAKVSGEHNLDRLD